MPGPALALVASAGLLLAGPALSQAVPKVFPIGEIEIGLTVLPFSPADILTVEELDLEGHPAVNLHLSPRLDPLIAEATRDRIGHTVRINLCGRRMIMARIQEELVAAAFLVTFPDPATAAETAALFRQPPCIASLS